MENNNLYIRTPKELFENHESWAYAKLIDPKKEARIREIFEEFSNTLYTGMTDEEHMQWREICSRFYKAEVRGFTLKADSPPDVKFPWEMFKNIQFDDVYIGSEEDIKPISSGFAYKGELGAIVNWLDQDFRKFLYDLGWKCGILLCTVYGLDHEKIIIYEKRNKEW